MANTTQTNSKAKVIISSFVGTTIEFYDFYIYATATALVIGATFFPHESEFIQQLEAMLVLGIAFLARPIGSILFGHFGDKIGRKKTLIFSLMLMGICTVGVGLVPSFHTIGMIAPIILVILRTGQGIALGGEWSGAALLATENAPQGKRGWYGMFPQLGAPFGFMLANGSFILLAFYLSESSFKDWGWRLPFIFSVVLIIFGLYVRFKLLESPAFNQMKKINNEAKLPIAYVFQKHTKQIIQGTFAMFAVYVLFYISSVFCMGYAVKTLGYHKVTILTLECAAMVFMIIASIIAGYLSDKYGRKPILIAGFTLTIAIGFLIHPLFIANNTTSVAAFLFLALFAMGLIFAPQAALLTELFPTNVRYTGSAIAYNVSGILGASFAAPLAQWLVGQGDLSWVGYYLSSAAIISLITVLTLPETKHIDMITD